VIEGYAGGIPYRVWLGRVKWGLANNVTRESKRVSHGDVAVVVEIADLASRGCMFRFSGPFRTTLKTRPGKGSSSLSLRKGETWQTEETDKGRSIAGGE
jgi:hypothetical protein